MRETWTSKSGKITVTMRDGARGYLIVEGTDKAPQAYFMPSQAKARFDALVFEAEVSEDIAAIETALTVPVIEGYEQPSEEEARCVVLTDNCTLIGTVRSNPLAKLNGWKIPFSSPSDKVFRRRRYIAQCQNCHETLCESYINRLHFRGSES